MSVSSWLAALRGPAATVQPESPRYQSPTWGGQFHVPPELFLTADQQTAISVAWACISAIVDPIAASELKVWQEVDGARKEDRGSWLYWLLNVEPHPGYTAQGWGELMGSRAVAVGNSYAYIRRDGSSRPYSMQPLDPARVIGDDIGGAVFYRYRDPVGGEVVIPEVDMIHFRGPMRGAFYGDSPLARASAALALARAQELYATAYYSNGAYPGVLLKPPANAATQSKEDKEAARSVWRKLFGGKRKGGMGILDPGWSLEVVETDAYKSQMVEARKFQIAEILRYFGVPGYLAGVPEAAQGYGKNLAELGLGFVRQTLEPWSKRFGEELRRKLLPDRRQGQAWFIEYDLVRLTKGDEKSVADAEDVRLKNGSATINEVRAARGEPALKGGDVPLINGKPLDQVLKPPPEPKSPPAAAPSMPEDPGAEMMAVLERHARRSKARRADIIAKGASPEDVTRHLDRLRGRARDEMRAAGVAYGPAMEVAFSAVEAGVEPERAAARLGAYGGDA